MESSSSNGAPRSGREKLSRLHPCMPVSSRICIIGAGPSGLSAAYALAQLGYENVTVLERHHTVGGMCESVEIEGRIYDLGGQVLATNSAPTIGGLAEELNVEFEDLSSHKLALIDCANCRYEDLNVQRDYMSFIPLTLKLQDKAKMSGRIGIHAVSDLAGDSAPEFLRKESLASIPKSIAYGYTASGYGFVQDMPYAYVHEFARTSMLGKIRRVKGGYTSLWQKLSDKLPVELYCNSQVIAVERDSNVKVRIRTTNSNNPTQEEKTMEFDKIIVSGALPFLGSTVYRSFPPSSPTAGIKSNAIFDMDVVEEGLFSKVKTIDYYTTVAKVKGLDHIPAGFFYCKNYVEDPATIGHPVAIQKFYHDTNVILFWSYGNSSGINGETVAKHVCDDVENMGGQVVSLIMQRRWTYFPHVSSQDMKSGFYDKLERELQGHKNTYYVGGLMAFELTEQNASYAIDLVCRHFSTDIAPPAWPYVKRLFPLALGPGNHGMKELKELPGVEFPELSNIDEYLSFWASHKIVGNNPLYSWIDDQGKLIDKRTYAELEEKASLIAQRLITSKKPILKTGDRVLLVHPPGLDFIDAFFGCLRARVLPVPLIPPDPLQHGGQALAKVESVAKSCNAAAILSTSSYHAAVRAGSIRNMLLLHSNSGKAALPLWPDLPWFHTDSWAKTSMQKPQINSWPWAPSCEDEDEQTSGNDYYSRPRKPKPEDVCFLQFTSGSTGDAKGVIITHGGLLHNVKLMRKRYKSCSRTVLVSWLPQYHDMGLIGGFLTALLSGGTAILFSPMTFIKNPLLWLRTITKYKATHSAGPNFAFELIVRRLNGSRKNQLAGDQDRFEYDLSSLIFLMIGAEPVRQRTLKRFIELLHPYGLREAVLAPGYGLAENCVFVSCAWGQGMPILMDWQGRICCGYVCRNDPDADVRIVDQETGVELEGEGMEGEIWVSSPSSGIGYWGRPELGTETFRNKIKTSNSGDICCKNFTRTGDLGRIVDGKLFVTGRIKDLIIVGGRNVYPADIEKTVESCSEWVRPGCCAVLSVPAETLASKGINLSESCTDDVGLVVVAEVRDEKSKGADPEVVQRIRSDVAAEHGLEIAAVNFIKPRTMCKTTSGKIRRFECLEQFMEGKLDLVRAAAPPRKSLIRSLTSRRDHSELHIAPAAIQRSYSISANGNLYSPANKPVSSCTTEASENNSPSGDHCSAATNSTDVVKFLRSLVAERTRISIDEISETESLLSYGIDSVGVVWAAQKLSNFLGVHVAAVDIFTATCISDVARFAEDLLQRESGTNVPQDANKFAVLHSSPADQYQRECACQRPTSFRRCAIGVLQFMGVLYAAVMLILPAYIACLIPLRISVVSNSSILDITLLALLMSPISWILYMGLMGIALSIFGNSFLQLNYTMKPAVSVWSVDFVKWWTMYRTQDFASNMLAVHLRGTVFISWWYRLLGASIGRNVVLDSIDITDPSLLSIADEAVISEGATLESHQVKDGMVVFSPVRIGSKAWVGPFAFLRMGTVLASRAVIPALHRTEIGQTVNPTVPPSSNPKESSKYTELEAASDCYLWHLLGIYTVGLVGSVSAAIVYPFFMWLAISMQLPQTFHSFSRQGFLLFSLAGTFQWPPIVLAALFAFNEPAQVLQILAQSMLRGKIFLVVLSVGCTYIAYGVVLSGITCILKWCMVGKVDPRLHLRASSSEEYRLWLVHRLITSSHIKFAKFLTGTEAFCMYLRWLGARIGSMASIRAINPPADPDLLHLGDNAHLGDFSKIVTRLYSPDSKGFRLGRIQIGADSVVGAQSVILPGSTLQDRVTLGAMSLAPMDCLLQSGGVYVGIEKPIMVKGSSQGIISTMGDDRIVEMDTNYRKIVGSLSAHLAKTTLKVQSRYFHRIGVAGRGTLTMFDDLPGIPSHDIFAPGNTFPVVLRHSNSLSADDDARIDARGASVRILKAGHRGNIDAALIDLTLKTGKAFYARTVTDFASWLMEGLPHREEQVKRSPHIRDAIWGSLRRTNSYADLHYYSNICRLFRSSDDNAAYYVKFKIRPADPKIGENAGAVEPQGLLPPETGAIPRLPNDTRPPLFLANDFRRRLLSPQGVNYVLQLQIRPIPHSPTEQNDALDCTKPWDEADYPFRDVGLLHFDEVLDAQEADKLQFNPFCRTHTLDVIRATSSRDSASIDHGRSLVYQICQHLRNGLPLPAPWKDLLEESDVRLDLNLPPPQQRSACPMASAIITAPSEIEPASIKPSAKSKAQIIKSCSFSLWLLMIQPCLQAGVPYMLLALAFPAPLAFLSYVGLKAERNWVHVCLLPVAYLSTGVLMLIFNVVCKWALVGRRKSGSCTELWSKEVFLDTLWQSVRTVAGDHFVQLCRGSTMFTLYMKSLGASIEGWNEGTYVDSMEAVLNPEMVQLDRDASVGRNALLLGHVYEGARVQFGGMSVGEGACVGSRGVVMPGVCMHSRSLLPPLSLAMKNETIHSTLPSSPS